MLQNKKSLIIICLSILTIGAIPVANAQKLVKPNQATTTYQITPSNLVYLDHRGYFQHQDIPKYSSLRNAYILGRITTFDIVQAAVQANRIFANYKERSLFCESCG